MSDDDAVVIEESAPAARKRVRPGTEGHIAPILVAALLMAAGLVATILVRSGELSTIVGAAIAAVLFVGAAIGVAVFR